jgi:tyrosine-protein kinase
VPDDSAWADASWRSPLHARGAAWDTFRILRTNLQWVDVNQDSHVITVTSPLHSEGKTTTATNLAVAFAQAGHQVLLIDADLRHPGLNNYLESGDAAGLTAVLIEGVGLEDAVRQGPMPNLGILPSGGLPPNPSELLQSSAMVNVLAHAHKTYDKVIIDSPPLLPVADAAVLAAQSDGALLVSRYGKTTRDQLRRSVERLAAVDANLVGAVLNRVPRRDDVVRSFADTRKHADDSKTPNGASRRGLPPTSKTH